MCGESINFDISLLSKLIKTICPLPAPVTGWDILSNSTDLSLAADIVRIKVFRNAISHKYHDMEINYVEFYTLWNEVKESLIRIAGFLNPCTGKEWKKAIDKLLNDPLKPEAESNAKELHEWYLRDMDVKEFTEQGLKNLGNEVKISSQRSEESISRVERQIEHVQDESHRLNEGVDRLQRELHDASEETVQRINTRIDEGNERLERGIQAVQEMENKLQQMNNSELIIKPAVSSSTESGGQLSLLIAFVFVEFG